MPGLILIVLLVLASPCWAHPDLQLQIEELTRQLAEDPGNAGFLLKRGDLHRRHNNWDLARTDFKRVRQLQPDNKDIDWFEGRLEVEAGQPEMGVVYLDRFLDTNPGHLIALQNRAQGYLSLGQPLLAAQDYQVVIQKSGKPGPSLYGANASALIAAGANYFPQSMRVVREGLLRFPGEVSLSGMGTDISLAVVDTDSAQDLINSLPGSILGLLQWQTRVALLDCEAGRGNQALQWFTRAIENPPQTRNISSYLSEEWLRKLVAEPTPENCQAAALDKLQTR